MKTSVIEFKLFDEIYCFNTKHVEYVFELEDFSNAHGFHDAVKGITKYNNDVMLLIDTAKLYSNKSLDMQGEKSVIVIHDEEKMRYGMLVDEIVKLEEVEEANTSVNLSSEDMIINHYKDSNDDSIINEIYPLPLLEKYHIPAMASSHLQENRKDLEATKNNKTSNYLLFKVNEKFYAISSKYVKEVLENDFKIFELEKDIRGIKGAIALREEIVQVVDFQAQLADDLVILEHKDAKIALEVDEVYDIEDFKTASIEYLDDTKSEIEAFYNHQGDVIALINPYYFLENKTFSKGTKSHTIFDHEQSSDMQEYLIFYIEDKKYSISMKAVRQVVESEAITKTQSSAIGQESHVAYLTTWQHHAISVLELDAFLHTTTQKEDTQIIFIESNKRYGAFVVDEIENIVYLKKDAVSKVQSSDESIISGAIVYENEVITRVNENFLVGVL